MSPKSLQKQNANSAWQIGNATRGLITAKLPKTAAQMIAMSVLVLNLHQIPCALGTPGCLAAAKKMDVCL